MAYEWAKPGAKCVSTITFRSLFDGECGPVKNGIYTVREVVVEPDESLALRLVEIRNVPHVYRDGLKECTFAIELFRPLVTKTQEQDIEMFLRLASPSPLERLDRLAEELDSLYND